MRPGERTLRNLLSNTLQPHLDDPRTTEVVVNRPGEIGVEQSGKWSWFDCPSLTFDKLDALGILSAAMTNREVDGSRPLCGSTLPDGQRIHICRPSATLPGVIALCIRKPPSTPRKLEAEDMEELFSEANTGVTRHSEADTELLKLYHDRKWVEFLTRAVKARKTIGATGLTGSGKAQPLDALVLTPTGFRPIGSLSVGDLVTTPSGAMVPISGVFPQGEKEIFRLTFSDGRTAECCDDHKWKVWDWGAEYETGKSHSERKQIDKGARWKIRPLSEIRRWKSKMKRAAIPLVDPCVLELPPQNLPIAPYAMGALLGDGCFGKNPTVRLSSADDHIVERVLEDLPDYRVTQYSNGSPYDHRILMKKQRKVSPLRIALVNLGIMGCRSHEKYIPEIYKKGSVSQRLSIIQGIMDTDGSTENGTRASFTSTSEKLAKDVQELAWSLGAIASIRPRQTYCTHKGIRKAGLPSWRVNIIMQDISVLFSLPRKLAQCTKKEMRHRLKILSIEPIGRKQAVCISVDHPEGLYVTNDYVVTHNTDFLRRLIGIIPENDRVVTIESDPEFGDVGPRNRINLFYNDDRPKQQAIDVVNASLRLYPKTLAFQEVRGPEAFPLMRGIISGHNSFTSWHADEGDEIGAMAMMLRQNDACRSMQEEQLTAMVRRCFDIIVSHSRDGGKFRVTRVWFRAAEEMAYA